MHKTLALAIAATLATGAAFARDSGELLFSAHAFDPQRDASTAALLRATPIDGPALHLVQFAAAPRREQLAELESRGIVPVHYVAHNGYLVWADIEARARLAQVARSVDWLRFDAPYAAMLKFDPRLTDLRAASTASTEVDVVVQLYRHAGNQHSKRLLQDMALLPLQQRGPSGAGRLDVTWSPILAYENATLRVRLDDLDAIAALPDVVWLGEQLEMRLLDEKQNLILTGDLGLASPEQRYLPFLLDRGFSTDPAQYPVIDVTDQPIHEGGSGVTAMDTADVTLRVDGLASEASRVLYFNNCATAPDEQIGDVGGHGSINASIIGGYDLRTGTPHVDAEGHQRGLGVNPFARLGSTALFAPSAHTLAGCGGNYTGMLAGIHRLGAQINTNSWGSTQPPATYESSAQAFDAGVRDADPELAGDQPLLVLVAAGNSGPLPATIGSPATAKNVITVAASENIRPQWIDGCGTGPSGANNANDVIGFSSRGPAPGGRAKPEVIAPGTHIQGSASMFDGFNGSGVCDRFYPPGQTVFAASSGTSHSTPAVAGITSLAWWWIERDGLDSIRRADTSSGAPSPALGKAWLMAHPTYLSGVDTNDDLPSPNQGYGMPNLTDMFDATEKVIVDQGHVFTDSGEHWQAIWQPADPAKPVRVALAWTDAPGLLGTSPQVNDLDLVVTLNGDTYRGNRFEGAWSVAGGDADTANNYEAVYLPAGAAGELVIRVDATTIGGNAVPDAGEGPNQDFALVCTNCVESPGFNLSASAEPLLACAGDTVDATVAVGQLLGFTDPVELSASGEPAGSRITFLPNPVVAPSSTMLQIGETAGAAAGDYEIAILGRSGDLERGARVHLSLFDAVPGDPQPTVPQVGGVDVARTPTFSWDAVPQVHRYHVQVAEDAGFQRIVREGESVTNAWTVPATAPLDSSKRYWWRVIARNACGDSRELVNTDLGLFGDDFELVQTSPPIEPRPSFTTVAVPGDCPVGVSPQLLFGDNVEAGEGDWTHGASGIASTWRVAASHAPDGQAWHVDNAGPAAQQWLVSPPIPLPSDLDTTALKFWNRQSILAGGGGTCADGALLEISTDDGSTWQPIDDGLLTDPYDGTVSSTWGNPLGGRDAWCGNPQDYLESVVDLQPWAGETVRLRFVLGNDRFAPAASPGWVIDDIRVTACPR